MDRKTLMYARMIAPGVMLMIGALVTQVIANRFGATPLLVGMQKPMLWVSMGLMAAGSIGVFWAGWRMWRWESGAASMVCQCGGLLGRERSGRYGWYRRCLACSRNVNERHWG